jgi:hypothetical protein
VLTNDWSFFVFWIPLVVTIPYLDPDWTGFTGEIMAIYDHWKRTWMHLSASYRQQIAFRGEVVVSVVISG